MTEQIRQKLSDSKRARWTALIIVSVTMLMGYFLTDVMAPLEPMLEAPAAQGGLGWPPSDYGVFSGSYGFINVFLFMLFFGGIILDKAGIRFTGNLACVLMVGGALIKFYAIAFMSPEGTTYINIPVIGSYTGFDHAIKNQVIMASLGFAIFGTGCEIAGITISKVMTKWFTGHELALAMGIQVALARLGTALTFIVSIPVATRFGISAPLLLGVILLVIGLLLWLVYDVMDIKLDKSVPVSENLSSSSEEDKFHISDLGLIFKNPGFWLITCMCFCFYGAIFPFLKFATKIMIFKYHVAPESAGIIPSLMPLGTIILTPLFGAVYDKIGKGATLMIAGSVLLTLIHICFALPVLNVAPFAIFLIIMLGVAFSLVPSAMWPSVPKIIPMKQLGSAYAIIFYIQNIGLAIIPMVIGKIIERNTTDGVTDFTVPMISFAVLGFVAVVLGCVLKVLDRVKGYALEKANIED